MVGFGQPMFDTVLGADPLEEMSHVTRARPVPVAWRMTELRAVIGKHDMNLVGHGLDEIAQELTGDGACGSFVQFHKG